MFDSNITQHHPLQVGVLLGLPSNKSLNRFGWLQNLCDGHYWKRWPRSDEDIFQIGWFHQLYVQFMGNSQLTSAAFFTYIPGIVCLFWEFLLHTLPRTCNKRKINDLRRFCLVLFFWIIYICVFPKIGVFPPKWMVYNGKPIKMGWFGGTPIFGNSHICPSVNFFQTPWGHWGPGCTSRKPWNALAKWRPQRNWKNSRKTGEKDREHCKTKRNCWFF